MRVYSLNQFTFTSQLYGICISHGDSPTHHLPRLHYVVTGARRQAVGKNSHPTLCRLPITMESLLRVWNTTSNLLDAKMLWAACCLGFFAFLRAGEFTYNPSLDQAGTGPPLRVSDISVDNRMSPTWMAVHLRRSKTDQFGHGITLVVGRSFQTVCPVVAMLSYLAARPPTGGPLFIFADGSPLSRSTLVIQVHQGITQAGFDPSYYSGHSFRIGAATTEAAVGIPTHIIKMLGRWESMANARYIRTPREQLLPVSA